MLRRGLRLDAGDDAVYETNECLAVADVAGATDQRVLPSHDIHRKIGGKVRHVDRHPLTQFRRQLGWRADDHGDFVAGVERLAQHVSTE